MAFIKYMDTHRVTACGYLSPGCRDAAVGGFLGTLDKDMRTDREKKDE